MKIINSILILIYLPALLLSQNTEWKTFTNTTKIKSLVVEEEYIWAGTSHGGVLRFNKQTEEVVVFNIYNSGLSNNSIRSICIDSLGNKWFGTGNGLVKYDDNNWFTYNTNNSELPSNSITSLNIDYSGCLWIRTFNSPSGSSIVKYHHNTWEVYENISPNSNNIVKSIDVDSIGNLWGISLNDGLVRFSSGVWTRIQNTNPELTSNHYSLLYIDNYNNKWLIDYDHNIIKFNDSTWTYYNSNNSCLQDIRYNYIKSENNGNLWLGTSYHGLIYFNPVSDTCKVYPYPNVVDIHIEKEGKIWFATDNGLVKYDGEKWKTFDTNVSGIPTNKVNQIDFDAMNNKWVATDVGVIKFDGKKWERFLYWLLTSDSGPRYSYSPSRTIKIDERGRIWTDARYDYSGGGERLAKFDGEYFIMQEKFRKTFFNFYGIEVDKYGKVWIATEMGGVAKYDGKQYYERFTTYNSELPGNNVTAIAIDSLGVKWIGTEKGLVSFLEPNWTRYDSICSVNIPKDRIIDINVDKDNVKWFGTNKGLLKYNNNDWTLYNTDNSELPHNEVYSVKNDSLGNIWLGTRNGLAKFDRTNWTVYNTSNSPIPDNIIKFVNIDKLDHKWIGTASGLTVFKENGIVLDINETKNEIPNEYKLEQNYPNPFNPSTIINYTVPKQSIVSIKIFNILGKEIKTLLNENKIPGNYSVEFSASELSSGVYFYRLSTENFVETKKMLFIK